MPILDLKDLLGVVNQKQPQTQVFTNGCFDLLHSGHLHYLQLSKQQGDFLIVAVNSDESVRRSKGPKRPIVPCQQRMELIAGLACVDYVISFAEETPLQLIQALTPQVLIKGADWAEKGVVGEEWVKSHGGRVFLAKLVPQISSSLLIKTIVERYSN